MTTVTHELTARHMLAAHLRAAAPGVYERHAQDVEKGRAGPILKAAIQAIEAALALSGQPLHFQCQECPLAEPDDCMKVGHCRHRDGDAERLCHWCNGTGRAFDDTRCTICAGRGVVGPS